MAPAPRPVPAGPSGATDGLVAAISPTSAATLGWLMAMRDFSVQPGPGDATHLSHTLHRVVLLDPGLDVAWGLGATMLVVREGGVGPRTLGLLAAGREARPDLDLDRVIGARP